MLKRLSKNWKQTQIKRGFKEDRWGNLKLQEGQRLFRWKTGKRVVRLEIKGPYSGKWIRLGSYLYPKNGKNRR